MRSATMKRTGKDPTYLAWLRRLECVVCTTLTPVTIRLIVYGMRARIEAAHVGGRGLSQKSQDRETIPLCAWHHRLGPTSHHRLGKHFWVAHGIDRVKLVAELNARYEQEQAA